VSSVNFVVINPCNWYNKGDVSNRLGLMIGLRKVFGQDIDITMESLTPREDAKFFADYGVHVIPSIFISDDNTQVSMLTKLILATRSAIRLVLCSLFYRVIKVNQTRFLNRNERILFDVISNADLVISSPGGFLSDRTPLSSLFPNLFTIVLSKIFMNKTTVIYAQSIGPFRNRLFKFLCALVLDKLDVIILREEISKNLIENMHVRRPKIFLTADSTFTLYSSLASRART